MDIDSYYQIRFVFGEYVYIFLNVAIFVRIWVDSIIFYQIIKVIVVSILVLKLHGNIVVNVNLMVYNIICNHKQG